MPIIWGLRRLRTLTTNGRASAWPSYHCFNRPMSWPQSTLASSRYRCPPHGPPANSLKYDRLCGKTQAPLRTDHTTGKQMTSAARYPPGVNVFATLLIQINAKGNAGNMYRK